MATANFHGSEPPGKSSPERDRLIRRLRSVVRSGDQRILDAFASVPRELFVPESQRPFAYDDRALPYFENQTISQPTMIAIMLDALGCHPGDRALEVGAGSGYAAALLSRLVARVDGIEIIPSLVERAREALERAGITNVELHVGDGNRGLPELAPFERILVSAGAPAVPDALVDQLAPGGRIAIPVDVGFSQILMVGDKGVDGRVQWHESVPCMFVPLVGGS